MCVHQTRIAKSHKRQIWFVVARIVKTAGAASFIPIFETVGFRCFYPDLLSQWGSGFEDKKVVDSYFNILSKIKLPALILRNKATAEIRHSLRFSIYKMDIPLVLQFVVVALATQ